MNFKHLHYFWWVGKTGSVARASEQLHLTAQTLSGQISVLEERLGTKLFIKRGRNLEMTDAGRLAFGYADEIFALGSELEQSLQRYASGEHPIEFRVGVSDAVSKTIAFRLLEPAVHLSRPTNIVCREGKLDGLLAELAANRFDLVIAGSPIPPARSLKAYNHRLGESGISFFASATLRRTLKGKFPACLVGAPLLLPGPDAALRARLARWFEKNKLRPRVVGEFDDSALMKEFGRRSAGVFIGPTLLEAEIEAQYAVKAVGRTTEVIEEFFAISIERRVTHPCVVAITAAARDLQFLGQATR